MDISILLDISKLYPNHLPGDYHLKMATLPTLCEVTYHTPCIPGLPSLHLPKYAETVIDTTFRLPSRGGASSYGGLSEDVEPHTIGCRTPGLRWNVSTVDPFYRCLIWSIHNNGKDQ